MAFTDADIATDIGNIFSDLSSTSANESITITKASDSTTATFDIIRASTMTARELSMMGWADQYRLSVYALNADGIDASKGDIVAMETEGDLRVLRVSRGPTLGYIRLDLGDQYSGGI